MKTKNEKKHGTSHLRWRAQHTVHEDGRDDSMQMKMKMILMMINESLEHVLFLKKLSYSAYV
jgi:hypothetical protein